MPFPGRGSPWLCDASGARSLLAVPSCFRPPTISPGVRLRSCAKAQPHTAPPTRRRGLAEMRRMAAKKAWGA